jgi:Tfp pilus assembly pilus retraction ATPase PilT
MDINVLLEFAVKSKALEMRFAPNLPPTLKIAGDPEWRRINVTNFDKVDIDALVESLLDAQARESLRFSGKCEIPHDVKGLGRFQARITPDEVIFVSPPAPPEPPEGARKPGFFKKLFGG